MISLTARHFEDIMATIRRINNCSGSVKIKGAIEWSEIDAYDINLPSKGIYEILGDRGKPYRIRLNLLRIGEVALYGTGGEIYSSLCKRIQKLSLMSNTVIINYEASLIDDAGYILDDKTLVKARRKTTQKVAFSGRNSASKPGQVAKSLEKQTGNMFRKTLL